MKPTDRREFLGQTGRWVLGATAVPALSAFISGCETMGEVAALGSSVAASQGWISEEQGASFTRSAKAVGKTFQDITPEQEYYIGRTVGAVILRQYRPYPETAANRYLNLLGQTVARASERPETFGGYHFLILDSDEINAFAAPGGLIFTTRGLLRCCRSEDAAAAVLAHEVAHVQLQHGLKAIRASRITGALTIIGAESARTFGGEDLAKLTSVFEDSVSDIIETLVNSGYSKSQEYASDTAAVATLRNVGYNPNGLTDMLAVMRRRLDPGGLDFAKTHPSPEDRIQKIQTLVSGFGPVDAPPARQARFETAMRSV
jgi:predicted Zn-dependent protease